jgi:hypothetical protein
MSCASVADFAYCRLVCFTRRETNAPGFWLETVTGGCYLKPGFLAATCGGGCLCLSPEGKDTLRLLAGF